jgi:DNA invertase Pin-like site-specific DNA recombinase/ssDNA-binding Zn-finger/Zn-ribbon topoisomerase 1
MNRKSAILWGRFSSSKQEDGASRERQEEKNRETATQRNIRVVGEHFDEAVSVKDGATPLFKKVVAELPSGVGIICENLDRISRGHPWRTKAYIADMLEAGHFIITWQDGKEYTADSINELDTLVMGDIQSSIAYGENQKKKKRVNDSKVRRIELARKGLPSPLGAWLPAHVRYDAETKKYIIKEPAREVTERIFTEYANGKGCSNIARGLNKDKIKTFRRKEVGGWISGTVSQILRCEGIIGTLVINGERIPKAFLPAIKEPLFYKVQAMFAQNKQRHGNYTSERVNNILRGVCKCYKCGNPMKIYIGDKGTMRIQCAGYRFGKCDQKNMVQYPEMEFEFAKWFIPHAKESLLEQDSATGGIEALETKAKALQKSVETTLSLLDSGLAVNEVRARLAKLETERTQVSNELEAAKAKQSNNVTHPDTLKELEKLVKGIEDNQEIRRKVSALIPSIVKVVKIDLSEKMFPSFSCELVNGEIIKWQYAPVVVYGYFKKGKIVEVPEGGSYKRTKIV